MRFWLGISLALGSLATPRSAQGCLVVPVDHPTVQQAIDAALDGDTVCVEDGTYAETLVVSGKSITIRSVSGLPETVVLDGGQAGRVLTFLADADCTLEGVTVTNGQAALGGGIACFGGSALVLRSCVLQANRATSMGGGLYAEGSAPDLLGNSIVLNTSDGEGGGLALVAGADAVLGENEIADNESQGDGGGIYVASSSPAIVGATIERNVSLFGSGGGVYFDALAAPPLSGNLIRDNVADFIDAAGGGIRTNVAGHEIVGNDLEGNSAFYGGGIWSSGAGVRIAGNTIAGNLAGLDGAGIWCSGDGTRIEANQIEGNAPGPISFDGTGGGIYAEGDDVEILWNLVHGNFAEFYGGIYSEGTGAWIADCEVSENELGGVFCEGSSTVLRCRIEDNVSGFWEPGITVAGGSGGIVDRCEILGNKTDHGVGGIRFIAGADATLAGCLVAGNQALLGPIQGDGGGVFVGDATVLVRACTITQNVVQDTFQQGSLGGGGLHVSDQASGCRIEGSIVWDNLSRAPGFVDPEIHDGSPDLVVAYSDVGGGWPGTANLNADPHFFDPYPIFSGAPEADFSLSPGSPCIDAANAAWVSLDTDLRGEPRLLDGDLNTSLVQDMGAYEFGRVALSVSGVPAGGETLTFHVGGPPGWMGVLALSRTPGSFLLGSFGALFFDPSRFFALPFGVFLLPADLALAIPPSFAGPATFRFQALGLQVGPPLAGHVSRALDVTIGDAGP
jgi:hypothetical protein